MLTDLQVELVQWWNLAHDSVNIAFAQWVES